MSKQPSDPHLGRSAAASPRTFSRPQQYRSPRWCRPAVTARLAQRGGGIACSLVLWLQLLSVDALKLSINGRECISQDIHVKAYITGSFVSLPGQGLLAPRASYNLQVINPQGRQIHAVTDSTQHEFSFKTGFAGQYRFCLEASDSLGVALLHHGPRLVLFEMHTSHTIAHFKGVNPRTEPLWSILDEVEGDLADMKSIQLYFRNRATRNRDMMLSTSARIASQAVLRWLTLLAVALFQVSFIRKLFDRPKRHRGEV